MSVFKKAAAQIAIEKQLLEFPIKTARFTDGDLMIAVMERGWVFVGFCYDVGNGEVRVDCAYNIHRWGTTKGLGELALSGPLKETVLNDTGCVYGKPVFLMATNIDNW
jgi:hypothetical protein